MSLTASTYDERLARRILRGEGGEVKAAITFLERQEPVTLEQAVDLLETYGRVPPVALEHFVKAWSIYWQFRDTPCD
jgi:sirohydrochlorin ferrochelatase